MNTNIQLIQYQLQQKLAWDELREYQDDRTKLVRIKDRTNEDEVNLAKITDKIYFAKKKSELALNQVVEAEHVLQSNQCEDKQDKKEK